MQLSIPQEWAKIGRYNSSLCRNGPAQMEHACLRESVIFVSI